MNCEVRYGTLQSRAVMHVEKAEGDANGAERKLRPMFAVPQSVSKCLAVVGWSLRTLHIKGRDGRGVVTTLKPVRAERVTNPVTQLTPVLP